MLGFIVAPFGQIPGAYPSPIAYSYGGNGKYLCPADPQFHQRGEGGFYYDTALGAIPTDAELAKNYGYTPVTSGWVAAKEGYFPSPWNPPNGWNPAGAYGPQMSLSGATVGMPLWGWALLAAGGVGAALFVRRKWGR